VLKTVQMHVKHVLYIRTLLRTLQAGIQNTNPQIKNLSRLLRKNQGSFMQISTIVLTSPYLKLHVALLYVKNWILIA